MVMIPLSLEELKKSNVLVTGTNQQGKSRLAMAISDKLISEEWQILIFDNVGHWKNTSSIPYYIQISENNLKYVIPKDQSIIYDISRLLPQNQKDFVEVVLADLWQRKLDGKMPKSTLIVTEESQLYCRHLRSLSAQNFMRIFSVGANYGIRCLAITPTLTGLDPEFIRLTSQRYHFREGLEVGAKRRFKSYYGGDWLKVALELDVGYCIYYLNGKLKVYGIPLFTSSVQSQPYKIKPIIRSEPQIKAKSKSILQVVTDLVSYPFGGSIDHTTTCTEQSNYDREDDEQEELDGILFTE